MTFDLAAIDRDLDALSAGLDVANRAHATNGTPPALDAIDAELAALAAGVAVTEARPARIEEAPTALRVDLSLAEAVAAAPEVAAAPLSEDSLFGDDGPFQEPPAQDFEGDFALDLDDAGQRVSVPDDLAAMLEGELDPHEFGPPRSSRPAPAPTADSAPEPQQALTSEEPESVEIAMEEGELEMFVEDDELFADDGSEPLPEIATSPSIPPEAATEQTAESDSEAPEKKGFFKKIFGK